MTDKSSGFEMLGRELQRGRRRRLSFDAAQELWAEDRSPAARDKVLEAFAPVAYNVAYRYVGFSDDKGHDVGDMLGLAFESMIEAVESYSSDKGASLYWWIHLMVTRALGREYFRLKQADEEFSLISLDDAETNLEELEEEHDVLVVLDSLSDGSLEAQVIWDKIDVKLPPEHVGVLRTILEDDSSFAEVARQRGVSRQAVHQAYNKSVLAIRDVLVDKRR